MLHIVYGYICVCHGSGDLGEGGGAETAHLGYFGDFAIPAMLNSFSLG